MVRDHIFKALGTDRVIDITTRGRKTGKPRRIEIWFYNVDGGIYLSGKPGKRDWYANLVNSPEFTFHLKQTIQADLPAMAEPILDEMSRREIIPKVITILGMDLPQDLGPWLEGSPLVQVHLDIEGAASAGR